MGVAAEDHARATVVDLDAAHAVGHGGQELPQLVVQVVGVRDLDRDHEVRVGLGSRDRPADGGEGTGLGGDADEGDAAVADVVARVLEGGEHQVVEVLPEDPRCALSDAPDGDGRGRGREAGVGGHAGPGAEGMGEIVPAARHLADTPHACVGSACPRDTVHL